MRRFHLAPLFAALAALPALAQDAAGIKRAAPAEALVISGAYEIANEAGTRKCILLLRPSDAPGGYAIGFPAQCRMSIPALQKVQGWTVETMAALPRARIILTTADGRPEIDFREEGPNGAGQGRDASGQIYHIRPTQGSSLATRVDSLVAARPAPPRAYTPPPPDPAAMVKAAGAYAFIRAGDQPTGCTLTLEGAGPAAIEGKANLAPGCTDKGITFFNPIAWTIAGESLWLTGTRGRINFDRNRKGGWDKAPGQGAPLSLQK